MIFAFGNSLWAEIVEVSPVQRRYYLESEIELEAIPNYDIEDEGTSPTRNIYDFESVVFSKEYQFGNNSDFDSKEYVISKISEKSQKDKEIKKLAESISPEKARRFNRSFRNCSKLLSQIGGYVIMGKIGYERGNFKYESDSEKYFHGTEHWPGWYIYTAYNFHHPYSIPTNLPVGEYRLPIISTILSLKKDRKSPIKLLDLYIDNIQIEGSERRISWQIPETELARYEKLNSKKKKLFLEEYFSAYGEITIDQKAVIKSYNTKVYHDVYMNTIQVEKYHRNSKGILTKVEYLNKTVKFRKED